MIEHLLQAERLLIHGMLDQAEQMYASAAETDPRNAIARVGLARVALERGLDQAAHQHVLRALELDPENAAALRLEARLREVLAADQAVDVAGRRPATQTTRRDAGDSHAADTRPSEQAIFQRNPSMADHRRTEEQRAASAGRAGPQADEAAEHGAPRDEGATRKPSLLRRLFRE